ncbi:hypothetical protein ACOSQ3_013207 [Xanthoceras sorbifolium]
MEGFDISNLCASLSLSENDGPIATLDTNLPRIGAQKLSSCLVGKVLSSKVINREAFQTILPKIWKTSQIGEVCDIDLGATDDCFGKFLRVRVKVNISKPLQRCVRLILDDSGKASTMLFHYERLPEFCSHCGRLGHVFRECVEEDAPTLVNPRKIPYGAWLRASSPVRNRRTSPSPTTQLAIDSSIPPHGDTIIRSEMSTQMGLQHQAAEPNMGSDAPLLAKLMILILVTEAVAVNEAVLQDEGSSFDSPRVVPLTVVSNDVSEVVVT